MIHHQVYVFLYSILVGAILALIFDFFRLLRRKGNTQNFLVYLEDFLYWIIVAFVIVISAFVTNDGDIRGFMFIGYMIGAIFYLILLSNLFLKTLGGILDFFEKILKKIVSLFKKIGEKIHFKKKNVNI